MPVGCPASSKAARSPLLTRPDPLLRASTSPLHEVRVGKAHVLGVLQPGLHGRRGCQTGGVRPAEWLSVPVRVRRAELLSPHFRAGIPQVLIAGLTSISHVFGGVVEVGGGEADHGPGVRVDLLVDGGAAAARVRQAAVARALAAATGPLEPDPRTDLGPVARVAVQVLGTDGHGGLTRRWRPGAARTPRSVRPARSGLRRCRPRRRPRSTPGSHRSLRRRTSRRTGRTAR